MNTAQVLGYPLLIIAAFELILGLLLLRQNPRNSPANKATAACAFASALWSFSAALMYINVSLGRDFLFFARFSWVGWFTVPTAIQTVLYLADEQSRKARVIGWALYPFWTAVLGLCLFTDLVVTDQFMPLPYRNSPGPLELPLRAFGSLSAFWLIAEIIRLRRRTSGYRRSQLGYYLFGTVIFGTGGAVVGGLLQVFTGSGLEPSLSAYFSLPWVVMIFYAITRHRLFDIRIVVSRSLFILILSFSVSAFQFVLFKMLEPVVGAVATIFISVPLVGIVFFGTPLSSNVERWINELVLRGRSRYQQMLKDSAGALVSILDHDEVLRFTVETVRKGIGVQEVSLYLPGNDGMFVQRRFGTIRPESVEGSVLPRQVAARLLDTGQPIVREELAPDAPGIDPGLMETVRRMDAELILPLSAKGVMLGVLTLSGRSSGEPYLQGDIDALHTLTSHAAAALENARLFEEAVRARASQKESEDIFRTLAETTAAAIFIVRLDRILYVNKAGARMTGYGREELLAINPWLLIHPDHRSGVYERGRSFVDGLRVPPENEFRFVTKNGEERWVVAGTASIEFQGGPAILSTMVDITERKRAEEAKVHFFKESAMHYREKVAEQERFSAILQAASDGFWIVNEEGRIVLVNDAYCRISGYTREELLAMRIADLEDDESPETVREHMDRVLRTGHDRFETRHRRKDGIPVEVEVSVSRYKDETIAFAFIRDITDRKRAEKEQARFAAVVRATNEGFYICSNDSTFLFVNEVYCRMLGYSREQLLALSIKDVEIDESAAMVDAHSRKVVAEGHDLFETRHRRKDGMLIDLEINVNRFKDEDVFFAFARDITERKRAEEALRKSEERFRQVAETAQEWIWEVDREGRYTYASPVVATLLGYRPDEVVGKLFFYDFFVPEERERLKREAFQVFAARSSFRDFTNRNLHKDGREVYLSTSGTPLLDGAGNLLGYRGVDFDITERIRAEGERSRLYEESVIHYQALLDEQHRHGEEKEKILKDLHDGIGGITTNINLLAELARKQEDLPAVKRSLSTIAELSRESLSEIRSFLQSLDARELSWQAIAAEFRHIGSTVVESHGIRFSIDLAVPEGAPDPGSAVAMNLFRIYKEALANIIKHARATAVEVRFAVEDGRVSLEVRDNGVGLDGKRGSGRGIANMKNRAIEMGGDLTVASGNGTRLRIEFPIP